MSSPQHTNFNEQDKSIILIQRFISRVLRCFAGLNVYSMLKHETLVLSLPVLEQLEEKLLSHVHNEEDRDKKFIRST